jgi:hypothetical protein
MLQIVGRKRSSKLAGAQMGRLRELFHGFRLSNLTSATIDE